MKKSFPKCITTPNKYTLLHDLASKGSRPAQFILGNMYNMGDGVDKNVTKAVELYKKSAESGHRGSQRNLGIFYNDRDNKEHDHKEAFQLFVKAYKQKCPESGSYLGEMLFFGNGTDQDITASIQILRTHPTIDKSIWRNNTRCTETFELQCKMLSTLRLVVKTSQRLITLPLKDFESIVEDMGNEFTVKSISKLRKLASQGDKDSQKNLDNTYQEFEDILKYIDMPLEELFAIEDK